MIARTIRRHFPGLVEPLKRARDATRLGIVSLMARSRITAVFYYTLFSSAFRREQLAVLRGRREFLLRRRTHGYSVHLLRRNVHRLEKGFAMRPRRDVFAIDYIEETVSLYGALVERSGNSAEYARDIDWSSSILEAYFGMVRETPAIGRAKARFAAIQRRSSGESYRTYGQLPTHDVSPASLEALAQHRRSVRWFHPARVPRDLIDRAVRLAQESPSACNRQPYRYRVFDEPEDASSIAAIAGGTSGFAQNVQCLVVVTGDLGAYSQEADRHLVFIDASLSVMLFLLALNTLSLASCTINWRDEYEREERLRRAIALAPSEQVVMLIAVGWPDEAGGVPVSTKQALPLARSFDQPLSRRG